ncbi:MAG: ATP-binding protein [Myxococcota bacterium]
MERYWGQFEDEEARTRQLVEGLLMDPDLPEPSRLLVVRFQEQHSELGVAYRDGLAGMVAHGADLFAVDARVRGIDREPLRVLEQVVTEVEAARVTQYRHGQQRLSWMNGLWFAGVLFWGGLIGFVAQMLLGRWVSAPVARISAASRRLLRGDVETVIASEDATGEAREMLRTLDTLRASLAAHEAQRLEQAAAIATARARSMFVATMSHELRTPLHGIQTALNLLKPGSDEAQAETIALAIRSSEHLRALVDDVLTFSKIEAQELQLEVRPIPLHDVIRDVIAIHRLRAEEKGLTLTLAIAPEVPTLIRSDSTRLAQIVHNLVSNAIKFTENGQVGVRLSVDGSAMVRLEVQDTGIGMHPDKIERLFHAFAQADPATTRRFGGTGLGLAIARRIARLMGGDVTACSTFGEGSTFTLCFPNDAVSTQVDVSLPQQDARMPDASSLRILLVDDHLINRLLVTRMLEGVGASVEQAGNGADALERLARGRYDLVLMDRHMPVMDGIECTRRIRAQERRQDRPPLRIVALSAAVLDEERDMFRDAGVDGFLSKPLVPEQLFEVLRTILSPPRHRSVH